ncbi:MAG: NAD(P)H-dependent glycerol-3-phosphate dehydrogenase [bacterium]
MKAAILGTGSWGTSFGRHLAATWDEVALWGVVESQVDSINRLRCNPDFLPDVELPDNLHASLDLASTVAGASALFVVVPSQAVRDVVRLAKISGLPPNVPVICLAKGLEVSSLKRMSEICQEEVGAGESSPRNPVAVLLGPSHAEEVAAFLPTAVVLSGQAGGDWSYWQRHLAGPHFRVYTNDDMVGVEISSAFKNVIALAVGICDGLFLGDNTRGTLMTRGMAELARIGTALGGQASTFYGLAGIGDMITTCTSRHSRNRNFGEALARSERDPQEILNESLQVVEGVVMTEAALKLVEKFHIELPITKEIHDVLFSHKPPRQAIRELMEREPRSEKD